MFGEFFDKILDVAVHGGGDVAAVVMDAVVGDAVLRIVVGADFFGAITGTDKRFARIGGVSAVFGELAL